MKNRLHVLILGAALGLLAPALAPAQPAATTAPTTGTAAGMAATTGTAAATAPVSTAPDNDALLRETGRRLAGELKQAIVTVRIVLSEQASMGGQNTPETEIKGEASGTVISPDGLTIVPLSVIDPSQLISRYSHNDDVNITSRVKDIKFIFNKRDEVPAIVVLRDADLNIAFLRPKEKPAQPWKFVDLTKSVEPRLLEKVLVLARMGRVADREIGVMTGEIQSLVSKPRRFYVPSSELASGGLGVPIFTADGKMVGIVLMRTMAGDMGDGGALSMNSSQSGMLLIVLPAKDVQEVAVQAPEEAEKQPAASTATTTGTTEETTGTTEETTGTTKTPGVSAPGGKVASSGKKAIRPKPSAE